MAEEKSKKLIHFIRENSGLFTSIGVFAALIVYFNQFINSSNSTASTFLSFGSIAIYFVLVFLLVTLIGDAKGRGWAVWTFCVLIFIIVACFGAYTYIKFLQEFLLIFKIGFVALGLVIGVAMGVMSIFQYLESSRNSLSLGGVSALTGLPLPITIVVVSITATRLFGNNNESLSSLPALFVLALASGFFLIAFGYFIFKAIPDLIKSKKK